MASEIHTIVHTPANQQPLKTGLHCHTCSQQRCPLEEDPVATKCHRINTFQTVKTLLKGHLPSTHTLKCRTVQTSYIVSNGGSLQRRKKIVKRNKKKKQKQSRKIL